MATYAVILDRDGATDLRRQLDGALQDEDNHTVVMLMSDSQKMQDFMFQKAQGIEPDTKEEDLEMPEWGYEGPVFTVAYATDAAHTKELLWLDTDTNEATV